MLDIYINENKYTYSLHTVASMEYNGWQQNIEKDFRIKGGLEVDILYMYFYVSISL